LHEILSDDREFRVAAGAAGTTIWDVREAPEVPLFAGDVYDVAAPVVLTVGNDCAVGKMSVSLELDAECRRRGLASVFVPTGQTGIAIAGWGISVDAVVSDFIAGAAERLVLEGVARGGEIVHVEGQGSLLHPAYSGVTLGLLHGSAPHAFILCHLAGLQYVDGNERFPMPPLPELVALHERAALIPRPAKVVAIALNTSALSAEEAREAILEARAETGLPVDDPVRFGAGGLAASVLERAT
jgi:uncharacterized NAD-dependent epimerase/dehydratase family protein